MTRITQSYSRARAYTYTEKERQADRETEEDPNHVLRQKIKCHAADQPALSPTKEGNSTVCMKNCRDEPQLPVAVKAWTV